MKSAALSETAGITNPAVITLEKPGPVSAVGIGNTDGTVFTIRVEYHGPLSASDRERITTGGGTEIYASQSHEFTVTFSENGLYCLDKTVFANRIIISTDARFVGRFAAGLGVRIPTSVAKQPGWKSV
ncbi:MAG: hypothetical protein FWC64_07050 [Treponema sp.]|nr:hypothetical protein [Treponema sp.]